MSRKLFIHVILIVLACSCKKDKQSYFIIADVNGNTTLFNENATGYRGFSNALESLQIDGMTEGTTNTKQGFEFALSNYPSEQPIMAGTYPDYDSNFILTGTYTIGLNQRYYAGKYVAEKAVDSAVVINHPLTVIISSISNGYASGTFSGDFFLEGNPRGEMKSISDGKFSVPVQITE
jgi:hypothetical protein